MTVRDDARKKCFLRMADAIDKEMNSGVLGQQVTALDMAIKAFDSLHGITMVNLPEATEEMMQAWINAIRSDPKSCMNAALAAGDLTNAPEKKP